MKRIINGRKYDTDTATQVYYYSNGYYNETLYEKKTGEFFIYGAGGLMSEYGERQGDSYGYGKEIVPLSNKEAMVWAEKHMTVEEYEAVFGEVEE